MRRLPNAAALIRDSMGDFNRNRNKPKKNFLDESYVPPYDANSMAQSIDILKLSEANAEKLKKAGINTIFDCVRREERDFYRIPTYDKRSVGELKNALNMKRFRLKPSTQPPKFQPAPRQEGQSPVQLQKPQSAPRQDAQSSSQADRQPQQGSARQGNRPDNRDPRAQDRRQNNRPGETRQNEPQQGARQQLERKDLRDRSRDAAPPKPLKRILDPDGISEKRTKEEREKLRPPRPVTEQYKDAYVKINKNDKWGFADRTGKEVIAAVYDEVFNFKEDLCCVSDLDRYGFIDRKGNVIIPIEYDCAASFSEGYACVFKRDRCGYINLQNEVVIDFIYDAGTPVENGECRVKKDGKWGELHISDPNNVRWII